jgi:hypothetical protein
MRLIAKLTLVGGLMLRVLLTTSCSSACGLGLVQRLSFSSDPANPSDPPHAVPCCGGFLFQDVDLTATDIQQVDLANSQVNSGHLDAFLTAPDCIKLFDSAYNGSAIQPLCKIYIGPVAAGTVSDRQTIPKGKYRTFAQAWASTDTSNVFNIDVGIWTNKCVPHLPMNP